MKKLLMLWSLLLLCVVGVNAQTVSDEYLDIANYEGVLDVANAKEGLKVGAYDAETQTLVVNAYSAYQSNSYQKWQTQTASGSSSGKTWAPIGEFKGNDFWNDQHTAITVVKSGDERYYSYKVTGVSTISAYVKSGSNGRDVHLAVYKLNDALERGELVGSDQERVNAATILSVCGLDKSQKYEAVVYGSSSGNSEFYEISFSAGHAQAPIVSVMDYNTIFGTNYAGSISDVSKLSGTKAGVTVTYEKAEGSYFYLKDYELRIYPKNTLTFTAPTGYVIEKIVLSATSNGNKMSANIGTYNINTNTWTGESESVQFTPVSSMTSGNITIKTNPTYVYLKKNKETSAPLYIIGINGTWDPTNMTEMTYNEETQTYSYDCSPTSDAYFAIADQQQETEDWNDFNANHRWSIGTMNAEVVLGQEYTLVHGDFSNKLSAGTYTITVTKDFKMTVTGTVTPPAPATYTVAGDSEALFGSTWSAASEANDMVANPEVENEYVFEKENVTLTAGTILYKVVENHSWDVSYPTDNASLVIAADGTYNVKFTFNSETKAVTGTATAVTPPAPEIDKLYVIGDGTTNGWDRTAMDEMTWNEETQAFTYEYAPTNEMNYIAIADYQMTADEATADENWSVFNTHRYLIANIDGSPTLNTEYDLTKGDGSIILAKGTYTISITKGLKITITGEVAPPPAEDTYVVAGNGPATNGVEWDATAEVNKMTTEDNDTYTLVVENAELAADGIYTWKVVKNGSIWIPDGMGNDLTVDIAEDGIYTVTYKYVVSTGEETAVAEKTGDIPVVENTYTATFKNSIGWDKVYAYTFNPETLGVWPGTQLESVEDVLTISFKATAAPANIIFNNGNSGGRNQTEDLEFVDGQEYDMTPLTSELTIYNNWATLVPAFNVKKPAANDAVVYVISDVDVANGTVTASEPALDVIPAGMPVLVSSENNTVTFTESGATIGELAAIQNMLMAGDGTTSYALSDNVYTLYNGTFYLSQGVVATDKAYLKIDNAAAASSMRIIIDGETTGIRSVDNAKAVDGIYYNLAGQRLAAPQKGVNILNGRKVIIK